MKTLIAAAAMSAATPAAAEVVSASASGFHLRNSVTVAIPPDRAFELFGKVDRWWDPDHTYGGDAKALSLQLTPGGCFCEKTSTGGIQHLQVAYVDSPKRVVMTGGLGPLLYQAVAGVIDVTFEAAGSGSKVTLDYKAAGFATGGADKLAPLVDAVLGQQLQRYAAAAASAKP